MFGSNKRFSGLKNLRWSLGTGCRSGSDRTRINLCVLSLSLTFLFPAPHHHTCAKHNVSSPSPSTSSQFLKENFNFYSATQFTPLLGDSHAFQSSPIIRPKESNQNILNSFGQSIARTQCPLKEISQK